MATLKEKIKWYFLNIEDFISEETFDLLCIAKFNDNGRLEITDMKKTKEIHIKYWKRIVDQFNEKL
mgnify:CR=1 FL=1